MFNSQSEDNREENRHSIDYKVKFSFSISDPPPKYCTLGIDPLSRSDFILNTLSIMSIKSTSQRFSFF